MPKRRKDKISVPVMPQRFNWKTEARFSDFNDALDREDKLHQEGKTVKIKRRKNSFDVRVGTPIKKD